MSDTTLFDLAPTPHVMPMKYDIGPTSDHDERARRYYAESPALTPFSRVPVSFDVARSFGINSWARADKRALADSTSHSSGVPTLAIDGVPTPGVE